MLQYAYPHTPRYLYHGTRADRLWRILDEGLLPRKRQTKHRRNGTWDTGTTIKSNPDRVYLTSHYPGFFAAHACDHGMRCDTWAILVIDTHKLKPLRLYPDEDALEQAWRMVRRKTVSNTFPPDWQHHVMDVGGEPYDMIAQTRWFRDHTEVFRPLWAWSLDVLGTCCYQGTVSTRAIVACYEFATAKNTRLELGPCDASISITNRLICGERHAEYTRQLISPRTPGVTERFCIVDLSAYQDNVTEGSATTLRAV